MNRQLGMLAAVAIAAVAGCSSARSGGNPNDDVPFTTETAAIQVPPTLTSSPTPAAGVENLVLTQAIREQLIHAKAQEVGVQDSDFVRLYKGSAYYAIDHSTGIYWAAASVVPSRHSIRAQVSSQDEGGYNIFEMRPGSPWKIYDAGRDSAEARSGAQCPVQIPAGVLKVWRWAPNTCDPPLGPN